MPIKGISDARELPRLGKIRLGTKQVAKSGAEYPAEVPHFVLNPIEEVLDKNGEPVLVDGKPQYRENEHIMALIKMFGETPAEIKVVFPTDDNELICPQYMKWWGGNAKKGTGKLYCKGTGEFAFYNGPINDARVTNLSANCDMVPDEMWKAFPHGWNRICLGPQCPQAQPAPDSNGKIRPPMCKPALDLFCIVSDYSLFGVFQITTSSFQAMKNVNSCIDVAKNALRLQGIPSIIGVPMRLFRKRTPNSSGGVNYILHLEVDMGELENQKNLFLERKTSTLGLGIQKFTIGTNLLDQPDYDLLPKSDFPDRLQTGDDPVEQAAKMLPPPETFDGWIEDPVVFDLFDNLAKLTNSTLTPAKMKATAKNHQNKDALIEYLSAKVKSLAPVIP
jgi:hypothetical protein